MKIGLSIAAIAVISTTAVAGAQGKKPMMGGHGMTRAQWQAMYDQADKAFDKMDSKSIFMYMAPDFTLTMMGKTQGKDEAEAGLKKWFGMMKSLHCTMTITKVSGDMNHAVVVDHFNNWGMTKPDPKTHKSGKYVDRGTETATWEKMNGKWMMKSLVSKDEKMTMNGKPFNPNMGG